MLDGVSNAVLETGRIINGVDNPNLTSVDSTEPIQTGVDELPAEEKEGEVKEVKPVEKKEDKKVEVKKPDEEIEEKPKTKDAVQKRINELTKKLRTAERERDYSVTKRQETEAELAKLKAQVPATDKPKKEDFEDQDAYIEALTDWKIEQKLRNQNEVVSKKTEEVEDKELLAQAAEEIQAVVESGKEKYKDFENIVMSKDLIISEGMRDLILDAESPANVWYYLGQNPDVSAEIAKLSPLKAAKKFAEIEVELVKANESSEEGEENPEGEVENPIVKPVVKKLTKAPPPITPVRTTGVVEKDPSKMTPKEYRAWRESKAR